MGESPHWELKISKNTLNILIVIFLVLFGWFYFIDPQLVGDVSPFGRIETSFSFIFIDEEGVETLVESGDVFFEGVFFGSLENGGIAVPDIGEIPKELKLKGRHGGKNLTVEYDFPADYLSVEVYEFSFTDEDIDSHTFLDTYRKRDAYRYAEDLHWTRMPLKFFINTSGPTEDKEKRIRERQIREAMERLHTAVYTIRFEKANSSEDAEINFFLYMPAEIRKEVSSKEPGMAANTIGVAFPESIDNIIYHADVYVERSNPGFATPCMDSNLALHELLHAFGLEHSEKSWHIMSIYHECNPLLDMSEDIESYLWNIYRG
ncbi:hypothetical protein CMI48_00335 [Candidatus Pacearchaeota archaeon]|nr:hypothetical protein [Candidatus Pacearchaeota archaeon]